MTQRKPLRASDGLANVRYEIRGKLARRALALERLGYDIVSLNIGNPYAFGFRTPETMRLAMIENLRHSEGYVHQKGIFPAREAVVMQQQERGVRGVTAEEVFIGNGVSELIDLTLRALLNPGDEVLVPSPDYPLWTAAVNLNTGRAVHYPCHAARAFIPDPQEIEALVTQAHARHRHRQSEQSHRRGVPARDPGRDRADGGEASPGGAVRRDLRSHPVRRCRVRAHGDSGAQHAVLHDERPVQGLSGLRLSRRLGRHSPAISKARANISSGLELLSSLRLCSNVPGQWAVQTALGGYQSIHELTRPGGRLYESRQTILDGVARSKYLRLARPMGALYSFVEVRSDVLPDFDDQTFALDLLENKHVLVAPGVSFNVPYRNCFRITNLPEPQVLATVFARIEELLEAQAAAQARAAAGRIHGKGSATLSTESAVSGLMAAVTAGHTVLAPNTELAAALFDARRTRSPGCADATSGRLRACAISAAGCGKCMPRRQLVGCHAAAGARRHRRARAVAHGDRLERGGQGHSRADGRRARRAARTARHSRVRHSAASGRRSCLGFRGVAGISGVEPALRASAAGQLDCISADELLARTPPPAQPIAWIESPVWRPMARQWLQRHGRMLAPAGTRHRGTASPAERRVARGRAGGDRRLGAGEPAFRRSGFAPGFAFRI